MSVILLGIGLAPKTASICVTFLCECHLVKFESYYLVSIFADLSTLSYIIFKILYKYTTTCISKLIDQTFKSKKKTNS